MTTPSHARPAVETLEGRQAASSLLFSFGDSLGTIPQDPVTPEFGTPGAVGRKDLAVTAAAASPSRLRETDGGGAEGSRASEKSAGVESVSATGSPLSGHEPDRLGDAGLPTFFDVFSAVGRGGATGPATPSPAGGAGAAPAASAAGDGVTSATRSSAPGGTGALAATVEAGPKVNGFRIVPEDNAGGKNGGGGSPTFKSNGKGYSYSGVGNPADAIRTLDSDSGRLALVGGSTDVDAAFTWMGEKAEGGDFVVIRATGTDAYNPDIARLVPELDSVATLVINSRTGANSQLVYDKISQAEGIFIAGGDQTNYIDFWKDTRVEDAIYSALGRGVPVGGTSAGLAVLSEFDFYGKLGTITSAEALANPFDARVSLDDKFLTPHDLAPSAEAPPSATALRFLNDVITDSHFMQRDRMGRLITFMARLDNSAEAWLPAGAHPRGLAINEQTALLIDSDGVAHVEANGSSGRNVYFLEGTAEPVLPLGAGPLNYGGVKAVRAGVGDTFNLNPFPGYWTGTGVDSYVLHATGGVLSSDQPGGQIY